MKRQVWCMTLQLKSIDFWLRARKKMLLILSKLPTEHLYCYRILYILQEHYSWMGVGNVGLWRLIPSWLLRSYAAYNGSYDILRKVIPHLEGCYSVTAVGSMSSWTCVNVYSSRYSADSFQSIHFRVHYWNNLVSFRFWERVAKN